MVAVSTASISDAAQRTLGVWISPGLGLGYPELKGRIADLFASRVAKIPWLPPGWLAAVRGLQDQYPNDLVRPYPAMGSIHVNAGIPDWIAQSNDRVQAWQVIAKAADSAIASYAKKKQEDGRAELDRLVANAAFWNRAYTIVENIRDAVPNAGKWVLSSLWNGLGPQWKLIIGVGAVGAAVYFAARAGKLLKFVKV